MALKLKLHHKVGGYLAAGAVTDHAAKIAREHIFLVLHDTVSHAGWAVYTAAGGLVIIPLVSFYTYRHFTKGNKAEPD